MFIINCIHTDSPTLAMLAILLWRITFKSGSSFCVARNYQAINFADHLDKIPSIHDNMFAAFCRCNAASSLPHAALFKRTETKTHVPNSHGYCGSVMESPAFCQCKFGHQALRQTPFSNAHFDVFERHLRHYRLCADWGHSKYFHEHNDIVIKMFHSTRQPLPIFSCKFHHG